jgi:hypothetical protein
VNVREALTNLVGLIDRIPQDDDVVNDCEAWDMLQDSEELQIARELVSEMEER